MDSRCNHGCMQCTAGSALLWTCLCTAEVKKAISPSGFEWVYNTVHKGPVWAAAFSRDGEACI